MSQPADNTFVDATQIMERHGVSRGSISEWQKASEATGFPAVDHKVGRRQYWVGADVDAWFAQRADAAKAALRLLTSVRDRDPDELLTGPEVAALLGYKSVTTIHKYLQDKPGYFPEPDVVERVSSGRPGRPAEAQWRLGTILEWADSRPGKGRRSGSSTTSPALPEVPVDGDPDELLDSAQAAALLGYKSKSSFSSALAQGLLPSLTEGDARKAGPHGGPRRLWKRKTVLDARRGR